jgi:hypothetical protein
MSHIHRALPLGCIEMDRWPFGRRTLDLIRHLESGGTVPPIHVQPIYIDMSGYRISGQRLLERLNDVTKTREGERFSAWGLRPSGQYRILDGRHRMLAFRMLERPEIAARYGQIREGWRLR